MWPIRSLWIFLYFSCKFFVSNNSLSSFVNYCVKEILCTGTWLYIFCLLERKCHKIVYYCFCNESSVWTSYSQAESILHLDAMSRRYFLKQKIWEGHWLRGVRPRDVIDAGKLCFDSGSDPDPHYIWEISWIRIRMKD